jgi:hypothetical protein
MKFERCGFGGGARVNNFFISASGISGPEDRPEGKEEYVIISRLVAVL